MDQANDIAYKLRRGYFMDAFNAGDHVSIQRGDGRRQEFIVLVTDSTAFRVTVEQTDYEGLCDDELQLPKTRVPLRPRPQDEFALADTLAVERLARNRRAWEPDTALQVQRLSAEKLARVAAKREHEDGHR